MRSVEVRRAAAIAAGKATAALSRALGLGGGTTMPGRVARGVDADILPALAAGLRRGTVVVTGTNGKTTTARLISHVLGGAGMTVIHNRAGANLAAGIAAALVERASLGGRVDGDLGVFEVDEATLPVVTPALRPAVVVLTTLFRDQLDRYGEIDLVADRWRAALRAAERCTVVFNADDPLVADVAAAAGGARVAFGIADDRVGVASLEHAADARYCYRCGVPYVYAAVYFGHMGVYRCPSCAAARPPLAVAAADVELRGLAGSAFTLRTPQGAVRVQTPLPGLYNLHNVLAACAGALVLGIPPAAAAAAVQTFAPAFGRGERIRIGDREVVMLLAKNPAGFNEVLRTVLADPAGRVLLIAINDLTADGRDISWLWDVEFELLAGRRHRIVVSGIRAHDMDLRLKYAGVADAARLVVPEPAAALDAALRAAPDGRLYVLPTYTAMLALRKVLQQRGHVKGFWEQ